MKRYQFCAEMVMFCWFAGRVLIQRGKEILCSNALSARKTFTAFGNRMWRMIQFFSTGTTHANRLPFGRTKGVLWRLHDCPAWGQHINRLRNFLLWLQGRRKDHAGCSDRWTDERNLKGSEVSWSRLISDPFLRIICNKPICQIASNSPIESPFSIQPSNDQYPFKYAVFYTSTASLNMIYR